MTGGGGGGDGEGEWWISRKMLAAAYCESVKPGVRLEFHVGWSGSERPEAG